MSQISLVYDASTRRLEVRRAPPGLEISTEVICSLPQQHELEEKRPMPPKEGPAPKLYCAFCGAPLPFAVSNFCIKCGRRISREPVTVPVPVQTDSVAVRTPLEEQALLLKVQELEGGRRIAAAAHEEAVARVRATVEEQRGTIESLREAVELQRREAEAMRHKLEAAWRQLAETRLKGEQTAASYESIENAWRALIAEVAKGDD